SSTFRPVGGGWLTAQWRSHRRMAGWFAAYLALQAYAVAGLPTPRFPDTASYLKLSFIGSDSRPWTVPLFYKLLPTDTLRICGQVVVAAIAWWVLAAVVAGMLGNRRLRIGARLVVLLLGLTGPIVEWNSTILSESLSISLTALLVAGWLSYVRRPRPASAAWALLATLLWTFTRPDHVDIGVLITVAGIVAGLWRRDRLRLAVAGVLVLISTAGFVTINRNNATTTARIADIVQGRVLPNAARTTWFIEHGMPYDATMAANAGNYFGAPLLADPAFAHWASTRGEHVYLEYLWSHPGYTLWQPLAAISGERPSLDVPAPSQVLTPNPTPSLLSPTANYGRHRDLLPEPVQALLFEQGQIGDVLALGLLTLALVGLAWRRRRLDSRMVVPAVALVCCVPEVFLVWLADPIELDRHAVVLAVALRIALWVLAAVAADQLLQRKSAPPAVAATPLPRAATALGWPDGRDRLHSGLTVDGRS
ncbi:MAG TPA: hypothetical protein VG708_10280, partial [Mycobacteriales bacterium]|nr:hypothetical protein [Mycobacteriales bacterium]